MVSDPNKGLLPGEDFTLRMFRILTYSHISLIIEGLDRLDRARLREFLSSQPAILSDSAVIQSFQRDHSLIACLVDRGLAMDKGMGGDLTPWGVALSWTDHELVQQLLDRGAALDHPTEKIQYSPLSVLVHGLRGAPSVQKQEAAVNIAKELIARGVCVDGLPSGEPPLVSAARSNCHGLGEVFIQAGATRLHDDEGLDIFQIARRHGHPDFADAMESLLQRRSLEQTTPGTAHPASRRTL